MSIRELLVPLFFALLITVGFQYYMSKKIQKAPTDEPVSGQIYEVKHEPEVVAPLKWGIDFIDKEEKDAELVKIDTAHALLTFSSAGAALEKIEVKHGKEVLIDLDASSRERKAFLVAFDEKTPYYYTLKDKQETDSSITLHYYREIGFGSIEKIFTIDKKLPKIDLIIKLDAPESYVKKLRIFYPSPQLINAKQLEVSTFVNDAYNPKNLKMYQKINEIVHKTWRQPTIFGVADRFFVHGMIADPDKFVYRGAFEGVDGDHELLTQLEGHGIQASEGKNWHLTFYFGPKQASIMNRVDPRLEQLLDYGILSPFVKGILFLLSFFYKYVHNYGIAIILLTMLIRLLLLPLTIKGQRGMEKSAKQQAELQKKIQYLKQKFHDDPQRFRQEQAELVRKHGLGSMAGGCLPVLFQFPVFIALNRVLSSSIELYHASFLWIKNLSAPDPYYILPILAGAGILIHSLSMKKPTQQQFSMYAIALVVGAMMSGLAAGVVLFICVSTFTGILEMRLFNFKK